MSFLEITLILLFQSWYKASNCSNCALCSGVREGKYLNIISTAFMSAKLRQSPDFTKGLQDVLGRKGIKHRFRPKQMKCSALFRLHSLNMVKKSTQNESTTLENEPSQVQKKQQTTHFLLTNYAPHPFPLVSVRLYHRDGTSLRLWWKRLTLTKERFVDESEVTQDLVVQAFFRLKGYTSLLYEST